MRALSRQKVFQTLRGKTLQILLVFCIVGIGGAIIDYGSMRLFEAAGGGTLISRGASYFLGSLFAYYANSFFTFSGDRSSTEKGKAIVAYSTCFVVVMLVNKAMRLLLGSLPGMVFYAWFISQAVATSLNFLLQSKWVFSAKK